MKLEKLTIQEFSKLPEVDRNLLLTDELDEEIENLSVWQRFLIRRVQKIVTKLMIKLFQKISKKLSK